MANVNVENRTTETNRKSLQNWRPERGISTRGGWDPFFPSRTPSDFFNADPFAVMRHFREEMDRTLGRFFGNANEDGGDNGLWSPAIDIAHRDGQLLVQAELPGLKPEDVKVELAADALVIQGERKVEQEENKNGVFRSERKYGKFYREIPLPEGANAEQAKAEFHDGVLQVTVPVPEQKSNRRAIPIGTASTGLAATEESGPGNKKK